MTLCESLRGPREIDVCEIELAEADEFVAETRGDKVTEDGIEECVDESER